ncbi:MAG TPA: VWA domain-containing protein [Gemmataceae bacterium]|nr:VWA domain-containing protein [Gemmataceae bacterium]
MTAVRRLVCVGAVLVLASLATLYHLCGGPARGKDLQRFRPGGDPTANAGQQLMDDLAANKFAEQPVVTYLTRDGETLFALQVQAQVEPTPPRPRDYLIVIDNSASQAQGPLVVAHAVTEALVNGSSPDDRFAIWTVNTEAKNLTGAFKRAAEVQNVLKDLKKDYPSGATNLKKGLTEALASFERREGRQRVLLFLGDGMSILDPLTPEDRARLCAKMVELGVAFYPVPLGTHLDPHVLHGLASGTGGTAIRVSLADRPADVVRRVQETVSTPILYPSKFQLPQDVVEFFPAKLPPLRADAPTLVVGKIKNSARSITYTIEGTAAGKPVKVTKTESLPEPDLDNFFLVGMISQWRQAKDEPALIRADRALAFALQQNQLARADLLTQANWALAQNKLDAAWRLYDQARQLDPHDVEAAAGLDVVRKLREGQLTREQIEKQLAPRAGDQIKRISSDRLLALARQEPPKEPAPQPPAPPGAEDPLMREARQRQIVEEQRTAALVDEAIRTANRMVQTDPAGANEYLKRVLEGVRANEAIGPEARRNLANRLERALQNTQILGARIQRDQEIRLRMLTAARERTLLEQTRQAAEDRIRERMRVFDRLMDQAREEEAARQAQAIRADLLAQGQAVPVAVTGGYLTALNGFHLREMQELVRIRRERFLLTLMQVERSAVPFPDEPPVEFPPAAVWEAITNLRKEKYEASGFGPDVPRETIELRNKLASPVRFGGFEKDERMTLRDALDQLAELYGVTFDVNETAFRAEVPPVPEVLTTPVVDKQPLPRMFNVSLATVLRKLLARIPTTSGATYIIRRDTIEITTGAAAAAERSIRVYPVADLVIPIPNAFNTQSIINTASLFGFAGAQGFGGGLIGFAGGFGGFAGFPGFGGGFFGFPGAFGGFAGFGLPGFGGFGAFPAAIGFQGGALGFAGGGLAGLGGGFNGGNLGFAGGGGVNLGVGGGFIGFGGGQLGQFGNLGGQFGLQGGDQSTLLITLILQVVGTPRDWAPPNPFVQAQLPGGQGGAPALDPNAFNPEGNAIGFYPPAMALVVKGTSRIHTRVGSPLTAPGAQPPAPLLPNRGMERDPFARNDPRNNAPIQQLNDRAQNNVAGAGGRRGEEPRKETDPKKDAKPAIAANLAKEVDHDPRVIWEDALSRAAVEPGLVIAVADFLMEHQKYDHVAEFLKANLRHGIVVRPWVYEALAIALKEAKASPEEIERAELAVADLEPHDPQALLRSAQAMAEHKRYDRAVAFCRQASLLEPNAAQPYAEALLYAELGKDPQAMEWAAGNLVRQDWPVNNEELQKKAREKLASLARTLAADKRPQEAQRLLSAIDKQRQRDLVIRLKWTGEADLDLRVHEPTGSICSPLNRQTIGGGTLIADLVTAQTDKEKFEIYVAAEAFPGEYTLTVDRVWGRPTGDKAQVEIIEHQDTPKERRRLVTVDLKAGNTVTVKLEEGRRTTAAHVPPPALQRPEGPTERLASNPSLMAQLRDLASPVEFGTEPGIRGCVGGAGLTMTREPARPLERPRGEEVKYETKVAQFAVNTGANVTAQAAISADRRYVRLSMTPVFNTVTGVRTTPVINTSVLPGFSPAPRP